MRDARYLYTRLQARQKIVHDVSPAAHGAVVLVFQIKSIMDLFDSLLDLDSEAVFYLVFTILTCETSGPMRIRASYEGRGMEVGRISPAEVRLWKQVDRVFGLIIVTDSVSLFTTYPLLLY